MFTSATNGFRPISEREIDVDAAKIIGNAKLSQHHERMSEVFLRLFADESQHIKKMCREKFEK